VGTPNANDYLLEAVRGGGRREEQEGRRERGSYLVIIGLVINLDVGSEII
jgi:hypothetical protein